MSSIDKDGMLIYPKVILKRFKHIEHGNIIAVHGIVIHQTDSSNAQSSFGSYAGSANGAHFLIAKDGLIYQTASLNKRCFHVGRLIKSKCLEIDKNKCKDPNLAKIMAMSWTQKIKAIDKIERQKIYPDRFPVNSDSIGIEIVGKHIDNKRYDSLNLLQTNSLQWLIGELYIHFGLDKDDVFKHPTVSYKNPGEASSATWK
jgi:N-acetyl-anhydromuramyl-L-alanine amidase AmpD